MKTRLIFLIVALFIGMPKVTQAQFGAIRRAINRQIDHKIDSSVDKNAQEQRDKQAQEQNEQNQGTEKQAPKDKNIGLFGGKIDIKYKDNYDFTGRIHMQMENYDKKEVIKSDYYTYFNSHSLDAGIDMQTVDPKDNKTVISTVFLFDHDNRAFMSLFPAAIGTISAMPTDSALNAQAKARGENKKQPVVTRTGNSRVIAGFKCDEYKVVEPDKSGYSLVWMTKDFRIKVDNKYWAKSGMPSTLYDYPGFEGSVMLAMEEYDKNNALAVKMETKEVNENYKHSISTAGYTFTKMNFGQAGQKKK